MSGFPRQAASIDSIPNPGLVLIPILLLNRPAISSAQSGA